MTRALLAMGAKQVIAIERDERALGALEEIADHYPGRLKIVNADATQFDPVRCSATREQRSSPICHTTSRLHF